MRAAILSGLLQLGPKKGADLRKVGRRVHANLHSDRLGTISKVRILVTGLAEVDMLPLGNNHTYCVPGIRTYSHSSLLSVCNNLVCDLSRLAHHFADRLRV